MADRKVTRIEPLENLPGMQKVILHKKVAAYVRVSTDHKEQLSSFEAQQDYYMKVKINIILEQIIAMVNCIKSMAVPKNQTVLFFAKMIMINLIIH